jgi:hypothetical protein
MWDERYGWKGFLLLFATELILSNRKEVSSISTIGLFQIYIYHT